MKITDIKVCRVRQGVQSIEVCVEPPRPGGFFRGEDYKFSGLYIINTGGRWFVRRDSRKEILSGVETLENIETTHIGNKEDFGVRLLEICNAQR